MTTREAVLNYIREFTARKGYPPSLRDIADGLGLSGHSAVTWHVRKLEAEGLICHDAYVARSWRVIADKPID